jgi:hypothetical protein
MDDLEEELDFQRCPFPERSRNISRFSSSSETYHMVYFHFSSESIQRSLSLHAILSHDFHCLFPQMAISIRQIDEGTSNEFSGLTRGD